MFKIIGEEIKIVPSDILNESRQTKKKLKETRSVKVRPAVEQWLGRVNTDTIGRGEPSVATKTLVMNTFKSEGITASSGQRLAPFYLSTSQIA